MDNHRLNAFYDNLIKASSSLNPIESQITQLQKEAKELRDIAQAYASAQMFLQFLSTAAIVYIAYKASQKN